MMQKQVEFHCSVEIYEPAQPGFSEIEIKYDGYLVISALIILLAFYP